MINHFKCAFTACRYCVVFSHGLHVISDEIYALSVFDEHAKFTSILAVSNIPDRTRIHVTWSFSKVRV